MSEEKQHPPVQKINELSERMGWSDEEKTIFRLQPTTQGDKKELVLESGEWSETKPMFVYDENDPSKTYVFLSGESFETLLKTLQQLNQENFNLKLEKAIWKHTPLDFQDVWVVAMDKIHKMVEEKKQSGEGNLAIDLDRIIGDIKRDHPALFVNLNDLIEQNGRIAH